jgi:hypothetical protein
MAKHKRRPPRVPGQRKPPKAPPDVQAFEWHFNRRLRALNLPSETPTGQVPVDRLVEETVEELYGGWTAEAERVVALSRERYSLSEIP